MARQDANEQFLATSFLDGANAAYIEQLYAKYEANPASVGEEWQAFFKALEDQPSDVIKAAKGASWKRANWPIAANGELVSALDGNWGVVEKVLEKKVQAKAEAAAAQTGTPVNQADVNQATRDSVRAIMMIRAYRARGHLHAKLDPLGLAAPVEDYNELSPSNYGFEEKDLDRKIFIDNVLGLEYATVREMVEILERTYCSTIGVEFMHISNPEEKGWIQERIEGPDKGVDFTPEGKKAILQKLIEAEGFEQFIDVKYKGTKRFGLDGGESLIPALEQIIKRGGQEGLKEIILGMAHRGRLNVLTNVMGKPHRAVFHEFKGGSYAPDDVEGSGDVKYHLGASSDREFDGNKVHLSLTANPSHLEIVNPVVMGKARAKQDQMATVFEGDIIPLRERVKVMPLLIHGDVAFAGQGVISEILGLSGLRGYRVAGTMHVIINNQIGFTTNPAFSRSSPYPSDVAKMIEAPIFHVNGDDPEAVVYAAKIATEYRMKFHKPVVIDMFCYRRFGHNEGDEPSFTQPLMYSKIRSHKSTLELYSERLIAQGHVTAEEVERLKADWRSKLESEFEAGQDYRPNKADWLDGAWKDFKPAEQEGPRRGDTGVEIERLAKIGTALHKLMEEDPTFVADRNATTHELVARGLGELHLRIILEKLKNRFGVEVNTHVPKVAYKETIRGKADGHHRHKKQTGGAGQFGEVYLRIEPLPQGEGDQGRLVAGRHGAERLGDPALGLGPGRRPHRVGNVDQEGDAHPVGRQLDPRVGQREREQREHAEPHSEGEPPALLAHAPLALAGDVPEERREREQRQAGRIGELELDHGMTARLSS